jgi:hypothetical protein
MLDYFTHEVGASRHWKFRTLRKRYGWEGEGRFWALNSIIAESDNCRLDVNRKARFYAAADELDFTPEELGVFIEFLIEEVELLKSDDLGLYTDHLDEDFARLDKYRQRQSRFRDKKTKSDHEEKPKKKPKADDRRDFYREQFKLSEGEKLQATYFRFVAYLYNELPNGESNNINAPGSHVLKLRDQLTFEQFKKLHEHCKPRNITPISLLESWLNNESYSKGRVSIYATLRNWASREPIKRSNL